MSVTQGEGLNRVDGGEAPSHRPTGAAQRTGLPVLRAQRERACGICEVNLFAHWRPARKGYLQRRHESHAGLRQSDEGIKRMNLPTTRVSLTTSSPDRVIVGAPIHCVDGRWIDRDNLALPSGLSLLVRAAIAGHATRADVIFGNDRQVLAAIRSRVRDLTLSPGAYPFGAGPRLGPGRPEAALCLAA